MACAAPLYEERKQIVTGAKDVEPEQAAAPKEPAAKGAGAKAPEKGQGEEEEEVPAGIPDFWLSAMRANPQLADHVRALYSPCTGCALLVTPWPCCGRDGTSACLSAGVLAPPAAVLQVTPKVACARAQLGCAATVKRLRHLTQLSQTEAASTARWGDYFGQG